MGGVCNRDPVGASWLEKDSTKTIAGGTCTDLAGLRWIEESEVGCGTCKLLQTVEGSLLRISPLPSTVEFQQESQRSGDGGHLGQEFSQEGEHAQSSAQLGNVGWSLQSGEGFKLVGVRRDTSGTHNVAKEFDKVCRDRTFVRIKDYTGVSKGGLYGFKGGIMDFLRWSKDKDVVHVYDNVGNITKNADNALLEHFWGAGNAKQQAVKMEPTEWGQECRQRSGFRIKWYRPEPGGGIEG